MLLPHVDLEKIRLRDPDTLRSLLSQLSSGAKVGVIELLGDDSSHLIRAHADRYSFTIFRRDAYIEVFEHIGPQAVRTWRKDSAEDVDNVRRAIKSYFGECVTELESWAYLYTEKGWFIFRPRHNVWLPRVKRRVFCTHRSEIAVLHSRQNDSRQFELMEYVLETRNEIWRTTLRIWQTEDGESDGTIDEASHRVDHVGF